MTTTGSVTPAGADVQGAGSGRGWLTAHIGSGPALLLLGVVLPCVLVAATVVAARWLTRD